MTPFGKAVRHHRIEREILLGEMAEGLGVGSSFLSQVESGKKPIPDGFVQRVAAFLQLDASDAAQLRQAADLSTREFRLRVPESSGAADRILAGELVQEFARLTPDAKASIAKILRGGADD
jgi:HTH-type transcriptional regulator, competence development regulator